MDVRVDLRGKAMPKGVKNMRDEEVGRKGVTRGYGDAGVHRKRGLTAAASGGTLSSISEQPGGSRARVFGVEELGGNGDLIGASGAGNRGLNGPE